MSKPFFPCRDHDRSARTWRLTLIGAALLWPLLLFIHSNGFNLTDEIALRGFSALEMTVQKSYPTHFEEDFPSGAGTASRSLSALAYRLPGVQTAEQGLPIYYVMTALDIAFFAFGVLFLFFVLVDRASTAKALRVERPSPALAAAALATLLVAAASYLPSNNLARFGTPYFHGQFYGFGDGARLAAIGLALRSRWSASAIALGVAFLFHPIKALFGALFLAPAALWNVKALLTRSRLVTGVGVAGVCGLWLAVSGTTGDAGPPAPRDVYFQYTRLMQSHWYPIDLGVLTYKAANYLTPLLGACLAAMIALHRLALSAYSVRLLSTGILVTLATTFVGLVLSLGETPVWLTRISLPRASTLTILIALLLICAGAARLAFEKKWGEAALAAALLAGGFTAQTGFSEFLAIGWAVWFAFKGDAARSHRMVAGAGAICVAGLVLYRLLSGDDWLLFISPWSAAPVLLFLSGRVLLAVLGRTPQWSSLAAMCAVVVLCLAGAFHWGEAARRLNPAYAALARDFHDVQLWARRESAPTDVFLIDPCMSYGWREFSQRSSIGTPREWYMTGWFYANDAGVLARGEAIGKALGLNIEDYLSPAGETLKAHSLAVCRVAQTLVYDAAGDSLARLSAEHGVSYFVARRDKATALLDGHLDGRSWTIAYENDAFVVLALTPAVDLQGRAE